MVGEACGVQAGGVGVLCVGEARGRDARFVWGVGVCGRGGGWGAAEPLYVHRLLQPLARSWGGGRSSSRVARALQYGQPWLHAVLGQMPGRAPPPAAAGGIELWHHGRGLAGAAFARPLVAACSCASAYCLPGCTGWLQVQPHQRQLRPLALPGAPMLMDHGGGGGMTRVKRVIHPARMPLGGRRRRWGGCTAAPRGIPVRLGFAPPAPPPPPPPPPTSPAIEVDVFINSPLPPCMSPPPPPPRAHRHVRPHAPSLTRTAAPAKRRASQALPTCPTASWPSGGCRHCRPEAVLQPPWAHPLRWVPPPPPPSLPLLLPLLFLVLLFKKVGLCLMG